MFMFLLWFSALNNTKLTFFTRGGGLYGSQKKKSCTLQKSRFPSDKNLMCNFNIGNGLTDPKSVFQDIKLILKVFKINKIWVKPFFSRPPHPVRSPKIVFRPALSHFWVDFLKERYQIAQEDLPLQVRQVPYLIFLKHHLCLAHH